MKRPRLAHLATLGLAAALAVGPSTTAGPDTVRGAVEGVDVRPVAHREQLPDIGLPGGGDLDLGRLLSLVFELVAAVQPVGGPWTPGGGPAASPDVDSLIPAPAPPVAVTPEPPSAAPAFPAPAVPTAVPPRTGNPRSAPPTASTSTPAAPATSTPRPTPAGAADQKPSPATQAAKPTASGTGVPAPPTSGTLRTTTPRTAPSTAAAVSRSPASPSSARPPAGPLTTRPSATPPPAPRTPAAPTVSPAPSADPVGADVQPFRGPPAGAVSVCDKFGSTPVAGGRYFVQNNQWGEDSPQCVAAWDVGFTVSKADHHSSGGVPAAYPALVAGCHYGNCTTGTTMPRPISGISALTSSWSTIVPADGEWNVAYDIWFDPTARRDGTATGLELMIWLDKQGPQTPLGSLQDTVTIAGAAWEVWTGDNGTPVLSYVRKESVTAVRDLDLLAFFADAQQRGKIQRDWYLTSVQAGFEPVVGGRGLTTTSFSLTEDGTAGRPATTVGRPAAAR